MSNRALLWALAALVMVSGASRADAWDRECAGVFAVLPPDVGFPEGIEVDPDGNVYVASFGFTAAGEVPGPGRIFVYDRKGELERTLTVDEATSHLLGLRWRKSTGTLLAVDFGRKVVLEVDPQSGAATDFITIPAPPEASSPNDITYDSAGNIYVSDSFQGTIWRTGPGGGPATAWVTHPLLTTTGVPPFGANGLRFNRAETALFVANTGSDQIVRIPVSAGTPGTPEVFVNGINGADGLVIDEHDNLWVTANQSDEVVVVDPTARVIAKLGDFDGVKHGVPRGLLFPASLRFLGHHLLVTNLALDIRLVGLAPSIVSAWASQVERSTVSILPARIDRDGGFRGGGCGAGPGERGDRCDGRGGGERCDYDRHDRGDGRRGDGGDAGDRQRH